MLYKLAKAAAVVLALGAPAGANAVTLTQTITVPGNASSDKTLDFVGFGSGVTLTSATLSWNFTGAGTGSTALCATFLDCEPGSYTLDLEAEPTGAGVFSGVFDTGTDFTGIDNSTDALQSGSYSVTLTGSTLLPFDPTLLAVDGPVGSLRVDVEFDGVISNNSPAPFSGSVTLSAESVAVVPLPAGAVLLAGALGGLGLLRGRKTG